MTAPYGGYRDRLIIISFHDMLETALDALDWFNPARNHEQVSLHSGPWPKDIQIPYNTVTVSFEGIDAQDMEIGSNAAELTHVGYVDFYGEPGPPEGNGGEALGKHFIGDVRSIIVGEMPEIGRTEPVLDVYDWGLATPAYVFTVYFDTERIRTTKVHRYDQPWERNWYTCGFELIEERDPSVIDGGTPASGGSVVIDGGGP